MRRKHTTDRTTITQIGRSVLVLLALLLIYPNTVVLGEASALQRTVLATPTMDLLVRTGPGTEYQQMGTALEDEPLRVVGRDADSDWLLVELSGNQQQGWIVARFCEVTGDVESVPVSDGNAEQTSPDTPSSEGQVTVITGIDPRVRSGPGASHTRIGIVPLWTTLTVLGRDDTSRWILVEYNETQGWIAAWYSDISGDLASVPIVDADTILLSARAPSEEPTAAAAATVNPTSAPESATETTQTVSSPASGGQAMATTQDNMAIRSGPGASHSQLGTVPVQTTLAVLGRDSASRWIFIDYNGTQGWIAGWYCEITGDLGSVSVTASPVAAAPAPLPAPSAAIQDIVPHNLVMTNAVLNNTRSIYWRGQSYGNNPRAFSRIGDCETSSELFLRPIGRHEYDLGEFGYLQGVIDYFFDSYAYIGYGAHEGFNAASIMDPTWADPSICQAGESPLACEYRTHRPSVAFILLRTHEADSGPGSQFYYDIRRVVELTVNRGIIPVLTTGPYQRPPLPPVEPMNNSIRQVAAEYSIPLWDLWVTTESLYEHGVDESNHLTWMHESAYFVLPSIDKAMTRRNLEALQILYTLSTMIMQ